MFPTLNRAVGKNLQILADLHAQLETMRDVQPTSVSVVSGLLLTMYSVKKHADLVCSGLDHVDKINMLLMAMAAYLCNPEQEISSGVQQWEVIERVERGVDIPAEQLTEYRNRLAAHVRHNAETVRLRRYREVLARFLSDVKAEMEYRRLASLWFQTAAFELRHRKDTPPQLDKIPQTTFKIDGEAFQYRNRDRVFLKYKTPLRRKIFILVLSKRLHNTVRYQYHNYFEDIWDWREAFEHTCRNRELKKVLDKFFVTALGLYCAGGMEPYEKALRESKVVVFLAHWGLPADLHEFVLGFV